MSSPYEVLGVKEGASREECTRAFRKKVSELHPDRFVDQKEKDSASEQLKRVNDAYQVLKSNDFKVPRNRFEHGGGE